MKKINTESYDVGAKKVKAIKYVSDKKPATFLLIFKNDGSFGCEFEKERKATFAKPIEINKIFKTMAEVKDWFKYIMQEEMI